MDVSHLFFFALSFFIVLKAADYAIKYASRLARILKFSDFIISFFIVAIVSAAPETVISILSHIKGRTDIAVTALIGSDVIDLSFVFGIVALFANGIKIESPLMKKDAFYLFLLALPLFLGIDGVITRWEGAVLLVCGLVFLLTLSIDKGVFKKKVHSEDYGKIAKNVFLLAVSLFVMIYAADLTIGSLSIFASDIGLSDLFITLVIIGTGTCLPELLFTIESVRGQHKDLALGNILGVVIIDATIIFGILALIHPVVVNVTFLRVLLFFNALGACVLFFFIKTKAVLNKVEAFMLLAFYAAFIAVMFLLQS